MKVLLQLLFQHEQDSFGKPAWGEKGDVMAI